jgi:hypothetical protein
VDTVTFDDVPEAPPATTDPTLAPIIDTGTPPPNVSAPGPVRAAVVSNPVDNGSASSQPSALNITLAWQPPANTGGGTVRYRVYRTPMSGGNVNGSTDLLYEGPLTSVTVTVPDYGAFGGWVAWDVEAVNEAGPGPRTRPEADLPNLVGLHQWRAFSRAVAIGLQIGYNPQLGCASDNIVCSTNPGAGGRLALGSVWTITYDE